MTNTMDDISDLDFDQYLEGDSSLSKVYRKSAKEIVPPLYIDNLVMNEVKISDQINQLQTPDSRRGRAQFAGKSRSGWWSGFYQRAWIGPLAGAVCVSVLAAGLGLRADLFDIGAPIRTDNETLAMQTSEQNESASLESVSSQTVEAKSELMVADSAGSSVQSSVINSDENNDIRDTRTQSAAVAQTKSGVAIDRSAADVREASVEATTDPTAGPMVMAPANAMLEADGPRTPDNNDLAEPNQASVQSIAADASTTDTQESVVISDTVDVNALSESQLEQAVEQTEFRADSLESTNADLRVQLATLERKVFESAELNQPSSDPVVDTVPTALATEQATAKRELAVLAALQILPSQTEFGRELVQLEPEQIRQRLGSAEDPERYRFPLLAVIGAAERTSKRARTEALVEIYKTTYPNAAQLPADFLQQQ